MEKLLTPQEIADILKIKKNTVYEMLKRGEIPSTKMGKQIRIREQDFHEYISGQQKPPAVIKAPTYKAAETSLNRESYLKNLTGLVISGQNPIIDLLCAHLEMEQPDFPILRASQNDYNSMSALYFGKVHAACISLFDEDIKDITGSALWHLVPGVALERINLGSYTLGIYCMRDDIHNIQDLFSHSCQIINREKGSVPRIYLDRLLMNMKAESTTLSGYTHETISDISCATAVLTGKADAAIGSSMILNQFPQLKFIPLAKAYTEIVYPAEYNTHPIFKAIKSITSTVSFREEAYFFKG